MLDDLARGFGRCGCWSVSGANDRWVRKGRVGVAMPRWTLEHATLGRRSITTSRIEWRVVVVRGGVGGGRVGCRRWDSGSGVSERVKLKA